MNSLRWETCPLCQSANVQKLGPIRYRQPILFSDHTIELECDPILCECAGCGSWFTRNILPEQTALQLYQSGSSSARWADTPPFELGKSANIVARIKQHIGPGKKVLDVGCNTGELLDFARSLGAATFGIEPSHASRDVLQEKGHQAFASLAETADQYDVITAFDLIEHLYDVPMFLSMIHQHLSEDGIFIVLTGDNTCVSAKKARNHWWYAKAPEHVVFPSRDYLAGLDGMELLSVDATYASRAYYRPPIVVWLQYLRKTLIDRPYEGLPSLGPDHMLVALRKRRHA